MNFPKLDQLLAVSMMAGAMMLKVDILTAKIHTVEELKDWTKRSVWSKTTLITSGVGVAGVDPPSCKMDTFFLVSLALSLPIYRHFQSNGVN